MDAEFDFVHINLCCPFIAVQLILCIMSCTILFSHLNDRHYNFICCPPISTPTHASSREKKTTPKSQSFVHINLCCPIISPLLLKYPPFMSCTTLSSQSPLQCSTVISTPTHASSSKKELLQNLKNFNLCCPILSPLLLFNSLCSMSCTFLFSHSISTTILSVILLSSCQHSNSSFFKRKKGLLQTLRSLFILICHHIPIIAVQLISPFYVLYHFSLT